MNQSWAMLGTPWDEVEIKSYPMMVQAKLNGFRARWDGEWLVTRQNKVWKEETLPTTYDKLRKWSEANPGIILDGELYAHGCPWQVLEGICSVNRQAPAEGEELIQFHAFDIISKEFSEKRQEILSTIYDPWVAISIISCEAEAMKLLNQTVEFGFEGLMGRRLNCPYMVGRTEALIKLKPWKYASGVITGFKQGKDKYKGMLGSIEVTWGRARVYISGGLSDEQRVVVWNNQQSYVGKSLPFKYRDVSNKGIPLQPQLVKFS